MPQLYAIAGLQIHALFLCALEQMSHFEMISAAIRRPVHSLPNFSDTPLYSDMCCMYSCHHFFMHLNL